MQSLLTADRFLQLVAVLVIAYFGWSFVNQTGFAYYRNSGTVEELQERFDKCNKAMGGGK